MKTKIPDGYYIYGDHTGIYGNMDEAAAILEAEKLSKTIPEYAPKVIKAIGPGFNLYVLHPFRW
jgi:hypothetical protein